MTDWTLRRIIRETWRPAAGPRHDHFVAASSAHSMPMEWHVEDEYPGRGWIDGAVIGVSRVPSGLKMGAFDSLDALVTAIRDEGGEVIQLDDDYDLPDEAPEAPSEDEAADDDPLPPADDEPVEDEPEPSDDAGDDEADDDDDLNQLLAEADEALEKASEHVDGDGGTRTLVHTEPLNPPNAVQTDYTYLERPVFQLDNTAWDDDVHDDAVYLAHVNNTADYGVFISLNHPAGDRSDVSGLVHRSNLPLARSPQWYDPGDPVFVQLIKRSPRGLKFDMLDDDIGGDA